MTLPAGTVRLEAVVGAPTTRCAAVIAVLAAASVRPATSGALTWGAPVETTSANALPTTTSAPATGDWLITEPAGTVRLGAVVTVPTTSCAPVIAVVADDWLRPTTSGAPTCGKPVEIVSAIALLMATSAPAAGFWLMTLPDGTVRL